MEFEYKVTVIIPVYNAEKSKYFPRALLIPALRAAETP